MLCVAAVRVELLEHKTRVLCDLWMACSYYIYM